jgi:hypothetical protein
LAICDNWELFKMAILNVYKRKPQFVDIASLVEKLGDEGLETTLENYYSKPLGREVKSIVAGPSFLQFLNNLFQVLVTTGDIINLQSEGQCKFYMLSATGTWDEIIKLEPLSDVKDKS